MTDDRAGIRLQALARLAKGYVFEGIFHADGALEFIWADDNFRQLFDCEREEVNARGWHSFVDDRDLHSAHRLLGQVGKGTSASMEMRIVSAKGRKRWLRMAVEPVSDPRVGTVSGLIGMAEDITERKRLTEQMFESVNREQQRIGSDLHDELGQVLTGANLLLGGSLNTARRGGVVPVRDLEEIVAVIENAIETTRNLAHGLAPGKKPGIVLRRHRVYATALVSSAFRMDMTRRGCMSLVEQVRSFNRFYTREIGLLAEHLPRSELSLAAARVLYELAQPGERTAAEIIRALEMDKAHVSRIVGRFRAAQWIKSRLDPKNAKHQLLSLSPAGKQAFKQLNDGTVRQVKAMLAPIPAEKRLRLSKCLKDIQSILESRPALANEVQIRPLRTGDLGWITHRQAVLYAREHGWDWTYEGLVAGILAEFCKSFDAKREDAWIADLNGEAVGSIFLLKTDDPALAKLRLLYVEPVARGVGVGSRLVETCIRRAEELGYKRLTLWTNDVLASARKIYEASGFVLVDQQRHRAFGKDLVGQNWLRQLGAAS